MRIEIWSDIVCPWCYIGKRRLEEALAAFPHRDEVEIEWRSFELDPSTPRDTTQSVVEHLGQKYGGGVEGARQMMAQMQHVAAEVGLDYGGLSDAKRANTVDAHRLLHAAGDRHPDLTGDLKEALLRAYLVEGRDVADHDELTAIATDIGLDEDVVRRVLSSDEHRADVAADVEAARALGANGVPFFVIDRRYGISGAQPTEVFAQALEQAWADRAPLAMVAAVPGGAVGGAVCGPEGCDD